MQTTLQPLFRREAFVFAGDGDKDKDKDTDYVPGGENDEKIIYFRVRNRRTS